MRAGRPLRYEEDASGTIMTMIEPGLQDPGPVRAPLRRLNMK